MSVFFLIFISLFLVGICSSLTGIYLVLKKQSMLIDAISHSIFLGIVTGVIFLRAVKFAKTSHDVLISFPLLLIATLVGLVSVFFIELLIKSKNLNEDSATGIIFPYLFAIGMYILMKYARRSHIHESTVFSGNIANAVLRSKTHKITIFGNLYEYTTVKPLSIIFILIIVIAVLGFLFSKELKVSVFDYTFAKMSGISVNTLIYILIAVITFSAVSMFELVGAILSISFFVVIPVSAWFFSKSINSIIYKSIILNLFVSLISAYFSDKFNLLSAPLAVTINGIIFMICYLASKNGIIYYIVKRHQNLKIFNQEAFIIHLYNHLDTNDEFKESDIFTLIKHFNLKEKKYNKIINYLIENEYVLALETNYKLTKKGIEKYIEISKKYNIFKSTNNS